MKITDRFWIVVGQLFNPKTHPGQVFFAIVFLLGAVLVGRAVKIAIHRYLDRVQRDGSDPTAVRFLAQLSQLFIYILAFLFYAHLVPGLQRFGTAGLASVGVVSVVVGLAAQNTLGNLISGVSLVLYRPFKISDRLQVSVPTGLETGTVESINLGYTLLRTIDGRQLVIPNSLMAGQASINLSSEPSRALCVVSVIVQGDCDLAAARQILTEIGRGQPKTSEVQSCQVTALSGAGVTLSLSLWCADATTSLQLKSDILEAAKKQFAAAGIKLA